MYLLGVKIVFKEFDTANDVMKEHISNELTSILSTVNKIDANTTLNQRLRKLRKR